MALESPEVKETSVLKAGNVEGLIPDAALREIIATKLNIAVEDLTPADLLNVTILDINQADVADLTGIEQLVNVQTITIQNTNVTSLEPLKNLPVLLNISILNNVNALEIGPNLGTNPVLRTLEIKGDHVTDLDVIVNAKASLESLSITFAEAHYAGADFGWIGSLENLELLNLTKNGLTDLSFVSSLTNLKSLGAAQNKISDNSFLSQMTQTEMEMLTLSINQIEDISALAHFDVIGYLSIGHNPLSSIAALEGLKIATLNLDGTGLGNEDLGVILSIEVAPDGPNVGYTNSISLDGNHISDISSLNDILALRPGVKIYINEQGIYEDAVVLQGDAYAQKIDLVDYEGQPILWVDPLGSHATGSFDDTTSIMNWSNFTVDSGEMLTEWSYHRVHNGGELEFKGNVITPFSKVTVSIDVKDSTLYVGDTWKPEDNFIKALDSLGNEIAFENIIVDGVVDTTKPGTYLITYRYGSTSEVASVVVKENLSSVTAKDSTIHVGDAWNAQDNFVSATDRDGNSILFSGDTIDVIGSVDTQRVGDYKIMYKLKSDTSSDDKGAYAEITVHVIDADTPIQPEKPEKPQTPDPLPNTGISKSYVREALIGFGAMLLVFEALKSKYKAH
ncbi:bacterial Ig-like domain-containing protein [Erysipelothrix rhusiopathiae]|uniref:bacterial Ig-like domain-containing protein n=1 Tax=Erysipelothrix rhusiopathiae TaxID=1648 RepID=UPI002B247273|nr:bacterial Ig-like domain-containing protein [Erysipelothrix rhusiopathiae]WRB92531.1 bacterial Ig-like domain-containing protein [Erysipelothrix rhusiopathiae]